MNKKLEVLFLRLAGRNEVVMVLSKISFTAGRGSPVESWIYHRTLDTQRAGFSSISHVQALSAVMTLLFTLLLSLISFRKIVYCIFH